VSPSGTTVGHAYLYGLLPVGAEVPSGLTGVSGTAVQAVPLGAVDLAVSTVEPERFGLANDLVAHSAVLDRLAEHVDVVPMAIGTFIPMPPGEADAARLASADAQVRPRIAGAVQYTLSVRYVEQVALTELVREDREIARLRERTSRDPRLQSERMQLGERVVAGLERKAETDRRLITAALHHVRELQQRTREQPETVGELALLVDRKDETEFEASIESLAGEHADRLLFRLLGPQAPYDFVGGNR